MCHDCISGDIPGAADIPEIVIFDLKKLSGCSTIRYSIAGWSSLAARRAHNPKVAGSNPAPATRC